MHTSFAIWFGIASVICRVHSRCVMLVIICPAHVGMSAAAIFPGSRANTCRASSAGPGKRWGAFRLDLVTVGALLRGIHRPTLLLHLRDVGKLHLRDVGKLRLRDVGKLKSRRAPSGISLLHLSQRRKPANSVMGAGAVCNRRTSHKWGQLQRATGHTASDTLSGLKIAHAALSWKVAHNFDKGMARTNTRCTVNVPGLSG